MKYKDMTPEQKAARKRRNRIWIAKNREDRNAKRRKRNARHREEINSRKNKWNAEHREALERVRKYQAEDLNNYGDTKNYIRKMSRHILFRIHDKLTGYQIHHCFGYDDQNRFIYIPRTLHLQIHQLLRDKNIPADSDHWNIIRDLVNSCESYTYIRV
jgi:hypothetical protein